MSEIFIYSNLGVQAGDSYADQAFQEALKMDAVLFQQAASQRHRYVLSTDKYSLLS